MNKKLIIWIAVIFLGAIIIGAVWYAAFAPKSAPQSSQTSTTLPVSGSITTVPPSSATSSQAIQTVTLATQTGSSVTANDFTHNGVTIPDAANAGRYLLAGNLGYCPSDPQKCQAGSSTNFNIFYNSTEQSFIIDLSEEPIGQTRLDMEQSLAATLGLTEQQMCSLNYYVGVTRYVNSQFAGKNLGFSFCPGATVLPK
jgi:hypothetical protein